MKSNMNMRVSRLEELLVVVAAWLPLSIALSGEHVCHRVENYTVTTMETYLEPVNIHTLEWCLQLPPRCTQSRTELRERYRPKIEVRYRTVPECCNGYKLQESEGIASADAKCLPHCKKCFNGVCSAPNLCICYPGFHGDDCLNHCPEGHWGQDCLKKCDCDKKLVCNSKNGKCECPDGFTGPKCENPSARCHPDTFECLEVEGGRYESSGSDYEIIDFDKEANIPKTIEHNDDIETVTISNLPEDLIPIMNTVSTELKPPKTVKSTTSKSTTISESKFTSIEENQIIHSLDSKQDKNYDYEDEKHGKFQVINSPKTEYVKTANGELMTSTVPVIPLNVAAIIVIGVIISISLTSIAALIIFHVRSRIFKAAISMYNQELAERQYNDKDNISQKNIDFMATLPRTMLRPTPAFIETHDNPPVINFDDRTNDYANGTVTIGIRLSSNFTDLLESQYDKPRDIPVSISQKLPIITPKETEFEHVYAEIPFATPFYLEKNT